jgi:hypothetical protein
MLIKQKESPVGAALIFRTMICVGVAPLGLWVDLEGTLMLLIYRPAGAVFV